MKPIVISASDTRNQRVLREGDEFLYMGPNYLRIVSRGDIQDNEDPNLPIDRHYDYDVTIPKDKILAIDFGYNTIDDIFNIDILVAFLKPFTLTVPSREFGEDLYKKLVAWLIPPLPENPNS